jgi:hypothetical protein
MSLDESIQNLRVTELFVYALEVKLGSYLLHNSVEFRLTQEDQHTNLTVLIGVSDILDAWGKRNSSHFDRRV